MAVEENAKKHAGGSFLVEKHPYMEIHTPEDLTEEDHLMAESVSEFVEGEILPRIAEMEDGDHDITVQLLKKAGELGFLAAEIPEKYDGLELSKSTTALISEKLAKTGGFVVSYGSHIGIGTMPITYFGTHAQKAKYLPPLSTGEILAAYALTERSSGSDALNAKTKAVLSEDGKNYILNGEKMWITNAGFADLFIVFAKIDGEKFTGFIVERNFPGVSVGKEEKKMGIKSSSTRAVILEGAVVPVENVLGEIGKGHKIAFNILNIGRFKLGSGAIGGAKLGVELAAKYAVDRKAFGKSISEFGIIKGKLGDMVIQTFAGESMNYRIAGLIDNILKEVSWDEDNAGETILKGVEEYAIECAMSKVFCSEALDFVADEALQVHGGFGYSKEYDVERMYRDSRINRIFEGTNEINRMLIVDMLLKRAMKGKLPLMEKVQGLMTELMGMPSFNFDEDMDLFANEKKVVENAKKLCMFVAGVGFQKFLDKLASQQELLAMAADMLTLTFVMESALFRTMKKIEKDGEEAARLMTLATKVFVHDSIEKISTLARTGLGVVEEGDALLTMMAAARRLSKHDPVNVVAYRRELAEAALKAEGYPF
ncbi:MAG: acyl-CoA dehydrogenase [Acidobacteria bacterium]|nr:MAG: acyl-CoA dehydrogenase [Acidobacteriota bacterium]PIE90791.1 MAG: acyl-CoA dehydrogenase [Acidobacteriota bacterium]